MWARRLQYSVAKFAICSFLRFARIGARRSPARAGARAVRRRGPAARGDGWLVLVSDGGLPLESEASAHPPSFYGYATLNQRPSADGSKSMLCTGLGRPRARCGRAPGAHHWAATIRERLTSSVPGYSQSTRPGWYSRLISPALIALRYHTAWPSDFLIKARLLGRGRLAI